MSLSCSWRFVRSNPPEQCLWSFGASGETEPMTRIRPKVRRAVDNPRLKLPGGCRCGEVRIYVTKAPLALLWIAARAQYLRVLVFG
jgi:hypothetical protein